MQPIVVDRWIDVDSVEAKTIDRYTTIRKIIKVGVETGQIQIDNAGYMWMKDTPIHAELGGKLVGLRFAAKALN